MYLLPLFLTFIGSCLAGFFGKFFGSWGCIIITMFCVFFSLIISCLIFYEVVLTGCFAFLKFKIWINVDVLQIDLGFLFDNLSISMFIVVLFISFLVHLYSIEYMAIDPHLSRFMSYLSLFTFFMLILVSADNFIQMFVGWEGVGLCSYLLVNFWFTWIQANKAAIKAMLINWIGDFGLIIAILIIFSHLKNVDYASIFLITPLIIDTSINFLNFKINLLNIICFFLFIGAIGKSAQIGLHTWLPDAMEGPTPVSALIHAATMVTAGVFLIVWCSPIYEHALNTLDVIAVIGSSTALFAASIGLVQNDLKRVIAYSTCSQLGYMFFSCGLSNYSVGFFHLTNHAFFKALLFLSAGSVIHSINDNQDAWKMGGLKKLIPFTYSAVIIGSLALIGFPFLTGFYSKDFILEISFSRYNLFGYVSYTLGIISAFFTAFYSMRLICLTFLLKPTGFKWIICFAYDSGNFICFALVCLILPSIIIGYFSKDIFIGIGNNFLGSSIFINLKNCNFFDAEFINFLYKILPLIFSAFGFIIAFLFYNFNSVLLFSIKKSIIGKKIYYFFNWKWFFDKIYNEYFGQYFFKFSYSVSYKIIDWGVVEIFGPTGFSTIVLNIGFNLHKIQTNYLYHYTLLVLVGIALFFVFRELWIFCGFFIDYRLGILAFSLIFYIINYLKS